MWLASLVALATSFLTLLTLLLATFFFALDPASPRSRLVAELLKVFESSPVRLDGEVGGLLLQQIAGNSCKTG